LDILDSELDASPVRLVNGIILKSSFIPKARCREVVQATLKIKNGIESWNDFREFWLLKECGVYCAWVVWEAFLLADKLLFKIKP
jgi:hypothetical protein